MQNNSNDDRGKVGNRLRDARVMAGLSQEQAAQSMNLNRPAISEIESGKRKVSAEEIIQFSDLYKVDKLWLLLEDNQDSNELPPQVKFAARELSKLKPEEMNKVIDLIKMLPKK
jgi:transcriptional regulator with XRE-family HTH domain